MKQTPPIIKYKGLVTGLRISSVDDLAFIDNLSITPETANSVKLHTDVAVTQANMKISAAAGAAFIDDASGVNLQAHLGKYLVVKDSTGKMIKGWIKAAGSAEGYTELSGDVSFTDDSKWTIGTGWTVNNAGDGNAVGSAGVAGYLSIKPTPGTQKDRLIMATVTVASAANVVVSYGTPGAGLALVAGINTQYVSVSTNTTNYGLYKTASGNCVINSMSIVQVTAPSDKGVTISSTKNGTAMDNWEALNVGGTFNYNDAAGYTYTIYDRDLTSFTDGNNQIEIYDSTGKMLRGVLGAVGSAESLNGTLNVSNCENWTTGYDTFDGVSAVGFHVIRSTTSTKYCGTKDEIAYIAGALYKIVFSAAIASGASNHLCLPMTTSVGGSNIGPAERAVTEGSQSIYGTSTSTTTGVVQFRSVGNGEFTISALDVQKVTAPSALGAWIVNTKAGAVKRFAQRNAAFAYGQASYYVVVKKIRGPVEVATGAIAAGAALMDTTTANAFYGGGVNLTAYQDGKHRLDLYLTSSGVLYAQAMISGTAPGGLTLSPTERIVDPGFNDDASWNKTAATWTVSGSKGVATSATVNQQIYQSTSGIIIGGLYYQSADIVVTSGTCTLAISNSLSPIISVSGTYGNYGTAYATNNNPGVRAITTFTGTVDNMSDKQVTMPVATGALLLSSPGGARGYSFKHASFTGNEALTYKIMKVVD